MVAQSLKIYHSRLGQLRPHIHVESAEETIHPAPIEISETSGTRIRPTQGNYRKTFFGSALRANFSLAVASVTLWSYWFLVERTV